MMPLPSLLFLASALPQTPWRKTALPERLRKVPGEGQARSWAYLALSRRELAAGLRTQLEAMLDRQTGG